METNEKPKQPTEPGQNPAPKDQSPTLPDTPTPSDTGDKPEPPPSQKKSKRTGYRWSK